MDGRPIQGGWVIARTAPGAEVRLNGETVGRASARGLCFIGFDRDEAARARIEVTRDGRSAARELSIAPGDFDEQRISGLAADQVAPSDPKLLARIAREAELKKAAFASRLDGEGFEHGFAWPLSRFVVSGRFGNRRILNGVPKTPHYGIDLAAPAGALIRAPAPGTVVLAESNLHFAGGLTLIDHGQGLVSAYLHQSRVDVRSGQAVARGQVIGAVGRTGRATGPHLCWRLKWRGRNLDPSLLVDAARRAT